MVEEDVDELPQQVVERLDDLLADERVRDRGEVELPLGARAGREGDRQAAALARRGERGERVGVVAEAHRDVLALGLERDLVGDAAALAGDARARAARSCRRSPDGRTRPRRGARRSGRPASRRTPRAGPRARSARPSCGTGARAARPRRRRTRVGFAAVAQQRLDPLGADRAPTGLTPWCVLVIGVVVLWVAARARDRDRRDRGRDRGQPRPRRAPAAPSATGGTPSTPSPVFALTRMTVASWLTCLMFASRRSTSKSRCWSRSTLLMTTSSQARNMSGYFSGLSSPSVTEQTMIRESSPMRNSAGQTRLPTFSTMSTSMSSSGDGRQRGAHHVGVEMALAAEAVVGVELHDRDVQRPTGGRRRSCPGRRPRARRRAVPSSARPSSALSSSVVLPAPGALMRLTTVTFERSKSLRFAQAIVLFASSASSTTLTLVRCMPPPPRLRPRSTRP